MGRGKSKAAEKPLTLEERMRANREAIEKAQREFRQIPDSADDETFREANRRINQLYDEQVELDKEWRKAERERKKAEKQAKSSEPTKARFVENMNEAQLDIEISKAEKALARAKADRKKYGAKTSTEQALQDTSPLGASWSNFGQARRETSKMSESALSRGLKLEAAIKEQESAERRLKELQSAKKRVKGTGKTLKQIRGW